MTKPNRELKKDLAATVARASSAEQAATVTQSAAEQAHTVLLPHHEVIGVIVSTIPIWLMS
ncbi:hypothetical protein ABT352_38735 [Streptosporangium sp. NPDC000563]|uniref:hypothetical protein n=1 Tax=Streptosporangium sp. NPDC000563 TaxID=3154366 RepID=UPI0033221538